MIKLVKSMLFLSGTRSAIKYKLTYPALYSTFHPREFQFETSDGETGTLIHRFSRHIALTKRDFTDITKYNFKYSSFYPVYNPDRFLKQLKDVSDHDLSKLLCFTSDFRVKADYRLLADVMNVLDEEVESRVEQANMLDLLSMMHGFMYLLPNKITKLQAYQRAMPKLVELFAQNGNEKDFFTIAFFLGLWKKSAEGSKLMDHFLQSYLNNYLASDMDLMDFAVLVNASYKTSVRIANKAFLRLLVDRIVNFEGNDMAIFITLVKGARMNKLKSPEILNKLRSIVENDTIPLDFRALSHLFAYVADNWIKDDELIELFLKRSSEQIEIEILARRPSEALSQSFRPKDLARFLWSCSTLNISISQLSIDVKDLVDEIYQKIENEEFRFIPDTLVDTCLSLWIMNHLSVDLVSAIFGNAQFAQYYRKNRAKIESRRDLLLACTEIERPEAYKLISKLPHVNAFELTREAPEFLIRNRTELQRIGTYLEGAQEKLRITDIIYNAPIKFLNIPGLLLAFEDGKQLNVDVLDDGNLLSDKRTPVGLMGLKTRLLQKSKVECAVINSFDVTTQEDVIHVVEEIIQKLGQSATAGKVQRNQSRSAG